MRLKNQTAIITGGASGIGRATCVLFAEEGARVGIVDVNQQGGMKLVDKIRSSGGTAQFLRTDVTDEREVEEMVERIRRELGAPYILVTAAGSNVGDMPVSDYDMKQWDWLLNLNLRAVVLSCKHVLKEMIKAKRGSIINLSSAAGIEAIPHLAAYCSSKAAVLMLTKVMALENAHHNIRVNCICPGNTMTPLLKRAVMKRLSPAEKKIGFDRVIRKQQKLYPLGRWARPEEIARVALFLASDESSFITGHALTADGGYLAGRPGGDTGLIRLR